MPAVQSCFSDVLQQALALASAFVVTVCCVHAAARANAGCWTRRLAWAISPYPFAYFSCSVHIVSPVPGTAGKIWEGRECDFPLNTSRESVIAWAKGTRLINFQGIVGLEVSQSGKHAYRVVRAGDAAPLGSLNEDWLYDMNMALSASSCGRRCPS